jgi:hypothetical protein
MPDGTREAAGELLQAHRPDTADDQPAVGSRISSRIRSIGPVGRGFAAASIYTVASIVIYARTALPDFASTCLAVCGTRQDSKFYLWALRWMPYAMSHWTNPFATKLLYAPGGISLTWVPTFPGPSSLMAPITVLFGPILSYNLLLLIAPVTAAWAAYLLCAWLTKSFWPSIIGGAVFGFTSYVSTFIVHTQMNLVLVFPIPLVVYLVVRRVEEAIRPRTFVVVLALTLLALFSISTELVATLTFFGALVLIGLLVSGPPSVRREAFSTSCWIGVAYVIVGLVVSPFLIQAIRHTPASALWPNGSFSTDLLSFVVPPPGVGLGAGVVPQSTQEILSGGPGSAYLGPIFVLVPLLFAWSARGRRSTWLLMGFTALVAVLALGKTLQIAGRGTILMPWALFDNLPLLKQALTERFPVYIWLTVSVMTALWLAEPSRRGWARYALIGVGLLSLVPTVAAPAGDRRPPVPAFFTEGLYRTYISEGETVLTFPHKTADDLVWQASTDMYFRLPQGYLGAYPAIAGKRDPSYRGLARFIEDHDVGAVIVADPEPAWLRRFIGAVVRSDPIDVGGVTVYEVDVSHMSALSNGGSSMYAGPVARDGGGTSG